MSVAQLHSHLKDEMNLFVLNSFVLRLGLFVLHSIHSRDV